MTNKINELFGSQLEDPNNTTGDGAAVPTTDEMTANTTGETATEVVNTSDEAEDAATEVIGGADEAAAKMKEVVEQDITSAMVTNEDGQVATFVVSD